MMTIKERENMPERPLILFGKPDQADKANRHGGPAKVHYPLHTRQRSRLEPQFNLLQVALEKGALSIQETPDGIDPEYTLVFEAHGDLESFHSAVRSLQSTYPEVELLFESEKEGIEPDDDFYAYNNQGKRENAKPLTFKCFCVLFNHKALKELLSLWNCYKNDEKYKFPCGKTGLKNIFKTLKDVRLWGIIERFEETKTKEAWENDLVDESLPTVKCEIEFSYRRAEERRIFAERKIEAEILRIGGTVVTKTCIAEIGYHAMLVIIPRQAARNILSESDVSFIAFDEILFVNPSGQMIVSSTQKSFDFSEELSIPQNIRGEPVLALFDGLPQEHHPLLENFLVIDDPDDYTASYEIKDRMHGTAMASLILWGELHRNSSAISRKIYVRPIMKPRPGIDDQSFEYIPDDILLVDKINIAVRRIFEPVAGQNISTIKVINLSIGISNRPFYNMVSPLAKLLDWLSFKYKVLFIVSAGNYPQDIDLGIQYSNFARLAAEEKDKVIIQALDRNSRNQKLLSPAESINSLTAGALFSDNSGYTPAGNMVLPCSNILPSPVSALGRGINRSIKPDLLIEGGQNVVTEDFIHHTIAHWGPSPRTTPPGILHAKPVLAAGGKSVGYSHGTSNAAAILSHNAIKCHDVLEEVFLEETEETIPDAYTALLLKAMLVHGAAWREDSKIISQALNMSTRQQYYDKIHKFIGYGVSDIERVKECTKNRITLVGYDSMEKDSAHLYSIPLPFDFASRQIKRTLTVTLAYFTPIVPHVKRYRRAQVWFTLENGKNLLNNRCDASDKAVTRGTLQHERFMDDKAESWDTSGLLQIKVNCREDAGGLTDFIPYALFVTFEIAPEYEIDVYTSILERIRLREQVNTSIGSGE
jgi:hypothetical protein